MVDHRVAFRSFRYRENAACGGYGGRAGQVRVLGEIESGCSWQCERRTVLV